MAQGDTILVKDLPEELLESVGHIPDVATANIAVDEDLSTEQVGKAVSDPLDEAYSSLRQQYSTNLLEHSERAMIARAMKELDGKQAKVSTLLGISRATLRKRIEQYGLEESAV